jgi:tight adherence protein B
MTPTQIGLLIFLAALGLSLSAFYFLVEVPASRRTRSSRLAAGERALAAALPSAEGREQSGQTLRKDVSSLERLVSRLPHATALQRFLEQAGAQVNVGGLLLLSAATAVIGLALGAALELPGPMLVLTICGIALVPVAVMAVLRHRRLSAFEEQFPDAIELLARAVRAGHAFTTGFELIASEMPQPLAGEFRITYDQQNLGLPLREALDGFATRVPLPDVAIFVSALQIQRETGGNLAEILEKLAYVMRERFKLYRQVRVYTAEGRMSLYFLTLAPPVTAFLLFILNREYVMPLVTDPLGLKMTWAGVVLLVLGYLVIKKITSIRV